MEMVMGIVTKERSLMMAFSSVLFGCYLKQGPWNSAWQAFYIHTTFDELFSKSSETLKEVYFASCFECKLSEQYSFLFHSVQNLTWTVLVRLWHLLKFQFNLSVAEKVRFNQVCSECVPSSRFDRAGVKAKASLSDNCSQVQEISHSVTQSVLKLCYMVMVVFWKINLFTLCADVE